MTDDEGNIYARVASGEASEEEIEAYNEQREQDIQEHIETLNQQQQDAVDALRKDAQESLETETVELPSGVALEVRARVPPRVERLQDRAQEAEVKGDLEKSRRLNAEMLAAMVETEGYDTPEVWVVASQDGDAGMQWMAEVTSLVVEPAEDNAEALKGNGTQQTQSDSLPGKTTGKQSGWQRQR